MTIDRKIEAPLAEAAARAVETMQEALAEGNWEPDPDRDPMALIYDINTMIKTTPSVVDLAAFQDLAAISLAAMDYGDWVDVSEDQISDIQGFNFLTLLAAEMAPTSKEIAIAV